MQANNNIVVGLDIGTTKICAIVGQLNANGKLNILGMGKASSMGGVSRGVVANIAKTQEAIQLAIKMASANSKIEIGEVIVGIAGHHIKSLQHTGTLIRTDGESEISQQEINQLEADMYRLAVDPGDTIIHVLPQEYAVDSERGIQDPVGRTGTKLDGIYHIVTGQIVAAKNIKRCVEKAGLEVADLIVEPIASSKAVLEEEEMEAGVCLLDIGGGTSDLAIFKGGKIRHTAVVPFGGDVITQDIMEAFSLLEKQAEKLKTKFGCALPDSAKDNEVVVIPGVGNRKPKEIKVKNLARVIHARMAEIFELVDDEIFASGYKDRLHCGIMLTGGGAQLKSVSQLLEYTTGLEVNIGLPHQHLAKGMVEEVKSPMYATGIGLVLAGLTSQNKHLQANQPKQKVKQSKPISEYMPKFSGLKQWFKEDDLPDYNG
jgi:cell division protein FtsA